MRERVLRGGPRAGLAVLAAVVVTAAFEQLAKPKVYNAGIAKAGQVKIKQPLNYVAGRPTNPALAHGRRTKPDIRPNILWLALDAKHPSKSPLPRL
jgi:hypothetical protein